MAPQELWPGYPIPSDSLDVVRYIYPGTILRVFPENLWNSVSLVD